MHRNEDFEREMCVVVVVVVAGGDVVPATWAFLARTSRIVLLSRGGFGFAYLFAAALCTVETCIRWS